MLTNKLIFITNQKRTKFVKNLNYMEKKKQERKVIHIQIDGKNLYYGSIISLLEDFKEKQLGFPKSYIKNNLSKMGVLESKNCIIRQGILKTKNTKRGRPLTSTNETKENNIQS